MSSLFDRLKQSRGQQATQLQARLEQQGQRTNRQDPRIWKYTWNDKGISDNIIRFLPTPMVDMKKQEDGTIPDDAVLTPVAMVMQHGFQGPGGWYINNSPQTFGEDDPVRDHDRPLWQRQKATADEKLKDMLKTRLPSTDYYANILIIKDGTNPENNGKVMLFKFGNAVKKILDKTQDKKFEDDIVFDPYDAWEGANLLLKLESEERTFNGRTVRVPKFDNAKWDKPSPIFATADGEPDNEKIREVWEKEHSLFEFFDRKNFKSYAELEQQLRKVLNIPADQPLVEGAAATMAESPSAPADKPVDKPASTPDTGSQQQATPTPPADDKPAGGLDEFAQFLQK
ncbi:single stranded DNA-binding protein,phage-associated [Erwinia phage vB_EamM-Bue1]|uniref:Single-stranded DNA-binding protein n=1 Tax=Erwinia phage vB_EamM-Bue1 TaxID=2099338 RepID=A0A2P1JU60_9CAUD|nr:single stranded DNA-binding protein,phage-associated [Erwinia phage vB_EamM-Bue1]AVO22895.1 single stranded DNA-binding protein,phage-associated [Erwinia phage vB_EamM-Bue1]